MRRKGREHSRGANEQRSRARRRGAWTKCGVAIGGAADAIQGEQRRPLKKNASAPCESEPDGAILAVEIERGHASRRVIALSVPAVACAAVRPFAAQSCSSACCSLLPVALVACMVIVLRVGSDRMVLSVRRRIHCGMGRFWRCFFARIFFTLNVLLDGWRRRSATSKHGGSQQSQQSQRRQSRPSEERGAAAPGRPQQEEHHHPTQQQ